MAKGNNQQAIGATREVLREGYLWPSPDYDRQVAEVRGMIGERLYLVRLNLSDISLSATLENKPVVLLDVVDFPAPDPAARLYPHMLILSDGRGVNLGHVARLSRQQAFNPAPEHIVYQQPALLRQWLFQDRRLSPHSIAHTSRVQLARILGRVEPPRLK
jgi:hypothetical protein